MFSIALIDMVSLHRLSLHSECVFDGSHLCILVHGTTGSRFVSRWLYVNESVATDSCFDVPKLTDVGLRYGSWEQCCCLTKLVFIRYCSSLAVLQWRHRQPKFGDRVRGSG